MWETGTSSSTYAIAHTPTGGASGCTITAQAGEGGSINPSGSVSVAQNSDKTFTVTPEEGFEIADVLVDGKSVGPAETYTFTDVTSDHTIEAKFREAGGKAAWNPFTDVKEGDWFYGSVKYAYEHDLMLGVSPTAFSPYSGTTRGMVVTTLWRMEQKPESDAEMAFTDVAAGRYYSEAVRWAAEHKIALGYGAGRFGPDDRITREQLAAILYRYCAYKGYSTDASDDLSRFADRPSGWAQVPVEWAVGAGILKGKENGRLDPKGPATRAETAAMLERFLQGAAA